MGRSAGETGDDGPRAVLALRTDGAGDPPASLGDWAPY